MSFRGVHFALTIEQASRLLAAVGDDDAVLDFIEEVEDAWDEDFLAESDTAWDAIHRCFCNGELLYEGGEYPLNHFICGGRQLISFEETENTVSYVSPEQVRDVADAAGKVTREDLRARYDRIDENDYEQPLTDEDFDYTWDWFRNVAELYQVAAATGRAVIFTVDC